MVGEGESNSSLRNGSFSHLMRGETLYIMDAHIQPLYTVDVIEEPFVQITKVMLHNCRHMVYVTDWEG